MVTTALLRRKDFAPHSSCLELTVHENSDLAKVKATFTGRASASLEEVKLDLSGLFQQNHRNKKLRKLFKAIGELPYLKTLRFHYGSTSSLERLPVQLLTIALSEARRLEILELNHVNLTGTEDEFQGFLDTIRQHASLEVFSFSSSGCSSASSINDILQALSVTPKLEKVVLYSEQGRCPWGKLEGDAIAALCRSSTLKDLQHLVLYDSSESILNFFADEETVALSQALSFPNPEYVTQQQQQQQQQALENSNIIHNHPPPNNINNNLLGRSHLEEVMISCWPLGQRGVEALCQMIQTNTVLQKLTMVVYELDEDNNTEETCNVSNLATALQSNATLQSLEIHGSTELGKWMEESFLIMLQSNYALTSLKLCQDDALFLKPFLQFYLALNQAGRGRLLQNENASREEWVKSLIHVRDDLSCIFYFLSMNPLLCQCQNSSSR